MGVDNGWIGRQADGGEQACGRADGQTGGGRADGADIGGRISKG